MTYPYLLLRYAQPLSQPLSPHPLSPEHDAAQAAGASACAVSAPKIVVAEFPGIRGALMKNAAKKPTISNSIADIRPKSVLAAVREYSTATIKTIISQCSGKRNITACGQVMRAVEDYSYYMRAWQQVDFVKALQRMIHFYTRLFSIGEIQDSAVLQWSYGASLLFFYLTFESWIGSSLVTVETAMRKTEVCWPYFQGCGNLYFLHALPDGYSQSIWYMALYALILYIVFTMWKREWIEVHFFVMLLFAWKIFVMFVLSYSISGPYDYYHIAFTMVLLFLPYKEYFLKVTFVVLYFLSGTTKFDETWVLGTYFSTLQTGLPIFPGILTPFFTNLVIGMQVVGAWFLLSKHPLLQRAALFFFILFHLYSGILVYYHYPSVTLTFLLILFGPLYQHSRSPFTKKAIVGWCFICLLFLFQLPPLLIEGDRRLTLEGNRYGMYMFEANHQCISTRRFYRTSTKPIVPSSETNTVCPGQTCLTATRVYKEDVFQVKEERLETGAAWNRCDPYVEWSHLHAQCGLDPSIVRIALTFDHSINGGPFYRIVDTPNVCELSYYAFSHNDWILIPPAAKIIGHPVKDEYRY